MADVSTLSRVREVSNAVPAVAEKIATSHQPVGRFKTRDGRSPARRVDGPGSSRPRPGPGSRGAGTYWQQPNSRHLADHFNS